MERGILSQVYGIGLFGHIRNATIENTVILNADISGREDTGILIGIINGESDEVRDNSTISKVYAQGSVSAIRRVGGMIGTIRDSEANISDSHTNTIVSASDTDYSDAGGFTGSIFNNTKPVFIRCSSSGSVTGASRNVGGFIGFTRGITVRQSFSTADVYNNVTNQGNTGGFIGGFCSRYGGNAEIYDCFATGNVFGGANNASTQWHRGIGGFIGNIRPEWNPYSKTIENCFSVGTVTGEGDDKHIGGFIGRLSDEYSSATGPGNPTVNDCFWDKERSAQATSACAKASGLDTTPMKTKSTFTDANWDFDLIWAIEEIDEGGNGGKNGLKNDGYPFLQWQRWPIEVKVGPGETYSSLTGEDGLFAAINDGEYEFRNITAIITGDIPESGTVALGDVDVSGWVRFNYDLTIVPDPETKSKFTLSGNRWGGLIRLFPVRNINIDANVTIDGTEGKRLIIINTRHDFDSTLGSAIQIGDPSALGPASPGELDDKGSIRITNCILSGMNGVNISTLGDADCVNVSIEIDRNKIVCSRSTSEITPTTNMYSAVVISGFKDNILLHNNMIVISSVGNNSSYGDIYAISALGPTGKLNLFYNSIYLFGDDPSYTEQCYPLYLGPDFSVENELNVINNIFYNNITGYTQESAIWINCDIDDDNGKDNGLHRKMNINHNLYYVGNRFDHNKIFRLEDLEDPDNSHYDFTDWKGLLYNFDANSPHPPLGGTNPEGLEFDNDAFLAGELKFTDNEQNRSVYNQGETDPSYLYILVDYYGGPRKWSHQDIEEGKWETAGTDIGAYEFHAESLDGKEKKNGLLNQ